MSALEKLRAQVANWRNPDLDPIAGDEQVSKGKEMMRQYVLEQIDAAIKTQAAEDATLLEDLQRTYADIQGLVKLGWRTDPGERLHKVILVLEARSAAKKEEPAKP